MSDKIPHVLVILDGWGHREAKEANAIQLANSPNWDDLWQNCPHTLISGSGESVGLPPGQMGNSEVGHMNLGAGRVIDQDFSRISNEIEDKTFFKNKVLIETCETLAKTGKALHIMGLLSPGGVHSHEEHIKAAIELAFKNKVSKVYVHAFLDGRDVAPKSADKSLENVDSFLKSLGEGGIASIIGRYYAMDRDKRWERVETAYNLICHAQSDYHYENPLEALEAAYLRGESDEFVKASAISINSDVIKIEEGDALLFMNFRADRARQITQAFTEEGFSEFSRENKIDLSQFVTLTKYADSFSCPIAYDKAAVKNSLGEIISNQGLSQLRIAETEKYAHVTFFFSGGREQTFDGEKRTLIPSPDVATYDLQPEMSAEELTDKLVQAIKSKEYDLIVCNYANGDMVGHTGNLDAAIEAVEFLDLCLGRVKEAILSVDGHCLITADHGNVEQMSDESTGQSHTAHTSEKVPLIYLHGNETESQNTGRSQGINEGALCDVAPTLLAIMGIDQPSEMSGKSLLAS